MVGGKLPAGRIFLCKNSEFQIFIISSQRIIKHVKQLILRKKAIRKECIGNQNCLFSLLAGFGMSVIYLYFSFFHNEIKVFSLPVAWSTLGFNFILRIKRLAAQHLHN